MPLSQFTKGLPGQSPGCFWPFLGRPARDPEGPQPGAVHFFNPARARVTFNSNSKVTRAPAINKPRIKSVNCPTGAWRGPCRDPPRTPGQILKESTNGTRPDPLRYPGGSMWGPDPAFRGPGRSPAGALRMPERIPVGTLE